MASTKVKINYDLGDGKTASRAIICKASHLCRKNRSGRCLCQNSASGWSIPRAVRWWQTKSGKDGQARKSPDCRRKGKAQRLHKAKNSWLAQSTMPAQSNGSSASLLFIAASSGTLDRLLHVPPDHTASVPAEHTARRSISSRDDSNELRQ